MFRRVKHLSYYRNPFYNVIGNFCTAANVNDCSKNLHVSCWNCKRLLQCTTDRFFCQSCEKIQPPTKCVNYFQYLGVGEPGYRIDLRTLTSIFRKLQQTLHPDKFANSSLTEKEYSAQQASLINVAYRTLLEPLPRALYLLRLAGKPLSETDVAISDSNFLLEMFELNEKVNESKDLNYVKKIRKDMKKCLVKAETDFAKALQEKNFADAIKSVSEMKYYTTVINNVAKKLGLH